MRGDGEYGTMIRQPARSAIGRGGSSRRESRRQSWYNMSMDKKTIILVALAIIAIMNIAAFVLMGHDKKMARQGKWRVPEKRLFLMTACFGGLGGMLGMKVFHHKTRHWYFKVFFPVLLVVQIVLLAVGAYLLVR